MTRQVWMSLRTVGSGDIEVFLTYSLLCDNILSWSFFKVIFWRHKKLGPSLKLYYFWGTVQIRYHMEYVPWSNHFVSLREMSGCPSFHQTSVCISVLCHACSMPRPSHPPWLDPPNNAEAYHYSSASCYFLILRLKCLLQHPNFERPQPMIIP